MKDKNSKLKETRLLLNLYPVNSLRLERIEARLKVEGKTRTWWINAAIREKLDKDHPETNKPEGEYVPALLTLDTPEAQNRYDRMVDQMSRLLGSFTPAAPLKGAMSPGEKWHALNVQEKEAIAEAADKLVSVAAVETLVDSSEKMKTLKERGRRQQEAEKFFRVSIERSLREIHAKSPVAGKALTNAQYALHVLNCPLVEDDFVRALADYWIEDAAQRGETVEREDALELAAIAKGQEMTEEEKARILVKYEAVQTFQASCAPVPAETEDEDPDFWGDANVAKMRKLGSSI